MGRGGSHSYHAPVPILFDCRHATTSALATHHRYPRCTPSRPPPIAAPIRSRRASAWATRACGASSLAGSMVTSRTVAPLVQLEDGLHLWSTGSQGWCATASR
jgi:hypothetical protein